MHGSTKQFTLPLPLPLPGELHTGSGSAAPIARHVHGASLQYDDQVRQSASVLQDAAASGTDDAEGKADAEPGETVVAADPADSFVFASSVEETLGSLHAATRRAEQATIEERTGMGKLEGHNPRTGEPARTPRGSFDSSGVEGHEKLLMTLIICELRPIAGCFAKNKTTDP